MRYTFLHNFLWTVPFVAFIVGYHILHVLTYKATFITPSVVGCHIHDAITQLSAYQLNARILSQKEDQDIPEGIVMSQVPQQGQKIKAQQSVFLVVNRHPAKPRAPSLYNMALEDAKSKAKKQDIYLKTYCVESRGPVNRCIAQNIQPDLAVEHNELIAYFSSGLPTMRLMPDLRGRPVTEVVEFLKMHAMQSVIGHIVPQEKSHVCNSCSITQQRPLAGSIIDSAKPPVVHLVVCP
jgi:beta-lactam-binding protein with PASTA domain